MRQERQPKDVTENSSGYRNPQPIRGGIFGNAGPDFRSATTPPPFRATQLRSGFLEIYRDAEGLCAYSLDSAGNIRRPHAFAKSIDIRRQAIDFGLGLAGELLDLEHQQRFYDAIVEIILEFVPENSRAEVIAKLEALLGAERERDG